MKSMTTEEFAKYLGISRSTVSRVLNNSTLVSQATREKVKKAMDELGFAPNAAASSLVSRRSNVIGFLIIAEGKYLGWELEGYLNDPFVRGVTTGIYAETFRRNHNMMFKVVLDNPAHISALISSGQIDSAIVSIGASSRSFIRNVMAVFKGYEMPTVYIDCNPIDNDDCLLDTGNYEGSFKATSHLIKLGHEKIAHLTGNLYGHVGRERLRGYCEALKSSGLELDSRLIIRGDFSERSGESATHKLLEQDISPTAIFAANDRMALAAIKVLNSKGIRVPDDMAVVGFDDIELASYSVPTLTTVRYPFDSIGKKAVELVFEIVESGNKENFKLNETQLIVRESTSFQ